VKTAILLACGNPLRGDDGVAVYLARQLEASPGDRPVEILCFQQWTPELAERISHAEMAIFVDASAVIAPGEIQLQSLEAIPGRRGVTTHSMNPPQLLALAQRLYGRAPERAFLLTIGGESFAHDRHLSKKASESIPAALEKIKALLAETSAETKSCS
jgi:hydrogenase maturation protease